MRKRSRKQSLIAVARAPRTASVSHKTTQSTISKYHTLLKQQSACRRRLATAREEQPQREELQEQLHKIDQELQDLGGIDGYQHASTLGQSSQRGGDTSKVLIAWLEELRDGVVDSPSLRCVSPVCGMHSPTQCSYIIRMLEIGALTPHNYASCSSWIDSSPIDLNSRHPDIVEQDFLCRPLPTSEAARFDVISCSLVLNFVPDPKDRGVSYVRCAWAYC